MADGRKLRGREKRASYFSPTASGEYVYTGPLYRPSGGRLTWRQAMARRWAMGIAAPALFVLCGFLPVPGLANTFYVIIPYAGGLIAAGSLFWAVCQMAGGERGLREYVYEATVQKLPFRTAATAVLSGMTLGGEVLFLALHGTGGEKATVPAAFCAAQFAALLVTVYWHRMERDIGWEC